MKILFYLELFLIWKKKGWNYNRTIVNCHIETIGKLLSDADQFTHKATTQRGRERERKKHPKLKTNWQKGIWDKLAVRLRIYEYNL